MTSSIHAGGSGRKCFANGTVYTPAGPLRADVLVESERIAALGDRESFHLTADDEIIDCAGRLVLPGFIDAHCHIQLDTGVFHTNDNWRIGSIEAAMGGITSVIDFVGPMPGQDLKSALDFRLDQARESVIDYAFHMTVLDATEQSLRGIDRCPEWGISSLKIYTTYRPNYYLDDGDIIAILERAAKRRLTVLVHCENDAVVTHETAKYGAGTLWRDYPERRPWIAEAEAANRIAALAQHAGARVVIAHNSCAETLDIVAAAKKKNPNIFNETAPQYLFLDSRRNHEDPEPWRYILQPPLRDADETRRMRKRLAGNAADMFITDHCAYTRDEKTGAPGCTPGGLPGFETLFPVLAASDDIPFDTVVRNLTENPAKIYGLWPHKGAIAPGFDADIVIVKDETYAIDEKKLHSFANYSPFHGLKARGIIERVFRRGELIVKDGQAAAKPASGRFISAKPAWNPSHGDHDEKADAEG